MQRTGDRQPQFQAVQIVTNSFPISTLPREPYTQYDVAFTPDFKGKAFQKRREFINHLQNTVAPSTFHPKFLYDGGAVGYANPNLVQNLGPARTFYVDIKSSQPVDTAAQRSDPERRRHVKIDFKQTSGIPIEPHRITAIATNMAGAEEGQRELITNFLQLVLRQGTNDKFPNNGKAYFVLSQPPDRGGGGGGRGGFGRGGRGGGRGGGPGGHGGSPSSIWLRNGLEIRRGIFHSVRPTVDRMIVTIDTVSTAFFRGGPLMNVVSEFLGERDLARLDSKSQSFHKMAKYFKGLKIRVTVPTSAARATKTIRGFIAKAGEYTFDNDGRETTIREHYKNAHGHHLVYSQAPGVVLQTRPHKVIIPMEVCELLDNQIFKKKIPEEYTADMVRFATMRPEERLRKIADAANNYTTSESMVQSGMTVEQTPITVNGKLLPPPSVQYDRNEIVTVSDGKWNVLRKRFFKAAAFDHWALLNCAPMEMGSRDVAEVIQQLFTCAGELGMPAQQPINVSDGAPNRMTQSLETMMKSVVQNLKNNCRSEDEFTKRFSTFILVIILPQEAGPARAELKFWGDMNRGIRTQCLRLGKVKGANNQYFNNVLLKVNARLGGTNNILKGSVTMDHVYAHRTMIVGADVSHPGPGVRNKPSVSSLVYSVDQFGTKYQAVTGIQEPRTEPVKQLTEKFGFAIETFANIAKGGPVNIIVFRDGISEGEYNTVAVQEIAEIEEACRRFKEAFKARLPGDWWPKITYIVVTKRHHTLLFPQSGSHVGDRTGNCKAGVAVESGIVQPFVRNFYLQSHSAIQGTSRSSHYIVLRDDVFQNNLTKLQELALSLCHVYVKATRSVSIPAPVYYADLACGRGNFHVDPMDSSLRFDDTTSVHTSESDAFNSEVWERAFKQPSLKLGNTMYYL